jgi:hypothetical protein
MLVRLACLVLSTNDKRESKKKKCTNYTSQAVVSRYRFTMIAFSSLKSFREVYSGLL